MGEGCGWDECTPSRNGRERLTREEKTVENLGDNHHHQLAPYSIKRFQWIRRGPKRIVGREWDAPTFSVES